MAKAAGHEGGEPASRIEGPTTITRAPRSTAGAETASASGTGAAGASRPRLALIGLGQIGGSIGLTLRGSGRWLRVGFDVDPDAAASALAVRAVDEVAPTLEAACASADLAVIATPVDTLPALIEAAAAALPVGATLLDTGSARGPVTAALERAAARGIQAVGGHPIAGHEGSGFGAARAGLFRDAIFALLPAESGVPGLVERLLRDLGARALVVDPAAHDRALARTSHLPYLLACALRELGDVAAAHGLAGPGFRDMTRLAGSDPRMAGAYCRANSHEVAAAWRELAAALERRIAELTGEARGLRDDAAPAAP
jgi:prephenate dehydrogenase